MLYFIFVSRKLLLICISYKAVGLINKKEKLNQSYCPERYSLTPATQEERT